MSDRDNAKRLMEMAGKDLKALTGMRSPKLFDTEIFGFHAQQAVEKTLKAWLSLQGVSYARIHDLEVLTNLPRK